MKKIIIIISIFLSLISISCTEIAYNPFYYWINVDLYFHTAFIKDVGYCHIYYHGEIIDSIYEDSFKTVLVPEDTIVVKWTEETINNYEYSFLPVEFSDTFYISRYLKGVKKIENNN